VPGKRERPEPPREPPGRRQNTFDAPAPPEGLRARHKRDKRERLRAAAWHLFTTVGYAETTTRAIAERAGVGTGTLFLYARDKSDLLFLVFEERLREAVDEGFRTLPLDAGMNAQVLHVFERLFAMYGENAAVSRQFVKEFPGAEGPNADRVNALTFAFLQRVAGIVERAQARGEVRKSALPVLVAQTFFAIYYMSLMTWLVGFNSLETAFDPLLRSSLDLIMEGLMERPSAR
jgi:AcrR family transcriptional regulator